MEILQHLFLAHIGCARDVTVCCRRRVAGRR